MKKEHLDTLMIEYDYKKNTIEDTKYFLAFMLDLYEKAEVK